MASVDIVVPCYKYGHFLRDCLPSIWTQVGVTLRVLVIDDASPDDSFAVATELAAADPRIEVVRHQENRGLVATLNEGIDWAAADYFLVLSADDLLVPGALARGVAALEAYPEAGLLHGAEFDLYPGDSMPVADPRSQAAAGTRLLSGLAFIQNICGAATNPVCTSTALVRTSAQKCAGYYNPKLPHTSDYEMWLRIAAISDVAVTEAVQGIRRHHGANMSDYYFSVVTRDYVARNATIESFFATAGKDLPEAAKLALLARRRLAEEAYWAGASLACRGQTGQGRELVAFALKLAPIFVVTPPLGYLLRRKGAFSRMAEVLGQAILGKRQVPVP
jgi:glycosyltransferase involved in cell wall biosynthesis